jgi:hypothetical protein
MVFKTLLQSGTLEMSYLVPLVAVFKLHFLALQVEPKIKRKSQNLIFGCRC